jgi:hypothetical protein
VAGAERELNAEGRSASIRLVLLVHLLVFVELCGIPKAQNLPVRMPRKDAVRALRLQRNHRDVPRAGAIRSRHTATRQAFEGFELVELAAIKLRVRTSYRLQLLISGCIYEVTSPRYALRCFATHVSLRNTQGIALLS